MKLCLALCLGVALACSFGATAADQPASDDVQDLIVFGDKRPMLLRLHVRIDGQSYRTAYRTAWDGYLKSLFQYLDRNGDGVLDMTEAKQMPAAPPIASTARFGGSQVNVAFNYRVVDADGDGKITLAEMAEYYHTYGGGALQIQLRPSGAPNTVSLGEELFRRLDTNKDGKLSRDELMAATALLELDQDNDELITPQELAPRLSTGGPPGLLPVAGRAAVQPAADQAPVIPVSPDDAEAIAKQLQTRYGLNTDALTHLVQGPPDVELMVRLGTVQPGEALIDFVGKPNGKILRRSTDGTVVLLIDGTRLVLHYNQGRPQPVPGTRERLLQQFKDADTKHRGYLDKSDAEQAVFFPLAFALLDRNGDGKLTEAELLDYIDRLQRLQSAAATCRVMLLTAPSYRGLFNVIDQNHDGRLGLRELRTAADEVMPLDENGDGVVTPDEIPTTCHLAIGLCQASFERFGGIGVFSASGMPLLALDWSGSGLTWFRKMDRNRDGDVSLREYLGPLETFRRIDTDGDGLISLDEAERAEALLRKK